MAYPIIRSLYDSSTLIRLRIGASYFSVASATIKASLIDATKTSELIADTTLSSSATGADWTNGLVAVDFTAAQTTSLVPGKAFIELAITIGGKKLPVNHVPVEIEKGWATS